jgi:hypothetical protein
MTTPSFTAELALPLYPQRAASQSRIFSGRKTHPYRRAGGVVVPALPPRNDSGGGSSTSDHQECLTECRRWNSDPKNKPKKDCATQCAWTTNTPHGTQPGTRPGVETCCIVTFAACIVENLNNPFGLIGCVVKGYDCADKAPCNTACDSWPFC